MGHGAVGKSHREGISIIELFEMFPTEEAATRWFEDVIWEGKRRCGHCGSTSTREVPNAKPMPYWCKDCRSYFSVRTGTPMSRSHIPLQKWAIGIYLTLTSLKSVSSMKLHRDLRIGQRAAWFMLHRIREAWAAKAAGPFDGPVEVDETYFGGRRRNMSNSKRKQLADEGVGRGAVGKTAVVGAKDRATNQVRAEVVERPTSPPCMTSWRTVQSPAQPCSLTTLRPTRACPTTMRRSSTRSASTFPAWRTPMASNPSGRCSSGRTRARSTRSARSI